MPLTMRTDRTSYAELSEVVMKLLSLDQELDKMLSEYQTSERRSEIDHLRNCCGPMTLLEPFISSLLLEGEEIEVQQDLREKTLEDDFYKCETVDWTMDHLEGVSRNSKGMDNGPHEWHKEEQLKRFPIEIFNCHESIYSSYFQLLGTDENRRDLWEFWSNSIDTDPDRWTRAEKAFFECREERRAFLNNLLAAIRNPNSDANSGNSSTSSNTSGHGFVYFIQNGDLCKIGITENLLRRMEQLKPDGILNVVRCSNFQEVERELHACFKDVRLPQTEYFRLSEEEIQRVHKLMIELAVF